MREDILSLAKKFIAIKSIPENPRGLDEILELALAQVSGLTVERFEFDGVKSALIHNKSGRPDKFKIILNGHLDVIPGSSRQYMPRVTGDKLFGVGSMDMKGNLAALIHAFRDTAKKVDYPLALQLVTDEEVGGIKGTKHQIEQGVAADFVLTSEPTSFDIVNKAKGILWAKVTARGTTAHGAYPWRGDNAILKMGAFLDSLMEKFPIPASQAWVNTVNVSQIGTSNQTYNKIPDDCWVALDIRYVPEEADSIAAEFKRLMPEGFDLEITAQEPPLSTDENDMFVKKLQQVGAGVLGNSIKLRGAQGSSDARHYARINCPGVEFGPIGEGIGSDNEWVDIPSLEKYYQIITRFLLSFKK